MFLPNKECRVPEVRVPKAFSSSYSDSSSPQKVTYAAITTKMSINIANVIERLIKKAKLIAAESESIGELVPC